MVHLILHGREEDLRFLLFLSIVLSQRENLANPLVNPRFTGANLAYAGKQLIEVIHQPAAALEPLVIEDKTLDDILT